MFRRVRRPHAVQKHLNNCTSRWSPPGIIVKFCDVRLFKRDPLVAIEVDAIVVGEHAWQPNPGGRRERPDADPSTA